MQSRISRCFDGSLAGHPERHCTSRIWVAYSGGVDSSVLLHAAAQCVAHGSLASTPLQLFAVHVDHGLHPDADCWHQFCRRTAARLGVAFYSSRVEVARVGSPEQAARNARYNLFRRLMSDGDVVMTAHHEGDQAETVLLQLLRGAGPEGLAAMPPCTRFGAGYLLRPLLGATRPEIEEYACAHRLEWLDDPTNDDLRYDRNYIRHRVARLLTKRWPAWSETVARVARHQAAACELIEEAARRHYLHCREGDGTLSVACCLRLRDAEKTAVLRYWLKDCKLPMPSEKQLRQLIATLLCGRARAGALMHWRGAEVRHYRGRLYAMRPARSPIDVESGELSTDFLTRPLVRRWPHGTDLELPEIGTTLTWRQLTERAPELTRLPALTVRLRCGGEKYLFKGGHKPLKKVFQERGVPPWKRSRVPLIYAADELLMVWN